MTHRSEPLIDVDMTVMRRVPDDTSNSAVAVKQGPRSSIIAYSLVLDAKLWSSQGLERTRACR
jgi:hypothetical protein